MKPEPGHRVGCWHCLDNNVFEILGTGTYVEDCVPLDGVGVNSERHKACREKTAKILLDSGEYIYGTVCYWTDEPFYLTMLETYEVKRRDGIIVTRTVKDIREWAINNQVNMEDFHKNIQTKITELVDQHEL